MSQRRLASLFVTLFFLPLVSHAAIRVSYKIEKGRKIPISALQVTSKVTDEKPKLIRELPYYIGHDERDLKATYQEWEYPSVQSVPTSIRSLLSVDSQEITGSELKVILEQGPRENRICLTFLGDGYTSAEKEKFYADVERTVKGLFETDTFKSYLPLFNVYAVFTPSAVSGIGDGRPKNTAFRLYRDPAGSKRAIMPGDENALSRAVRLAPKTDYPIVLANDEYYGGLGGRWAITTSSVASGLIVLRHELGHNFGEVGEEYDNGYVYSGANSSYSSNMDWPQWLAQNSKPEVHEAKLLSGDYVWKNLNKGDYEANVSIPSQHKWLEITVSTVGWQSPQDVLVQANGQALTLNGIFHKDRSFFRWNQVSKPDSGKLNLKISENIHDGDNVLGFALIYSMPENYNFTPNTIGAFATYDVNGRKTYRPTHSSCIMRDMELTHFCPVDQENMWLKFFERVKLIDGVEKSQTPMGTQVFLKTPPLTGLEIRWLQKGAKGFQEVTELRNQSMFIMTPDLEKLPMRVEVKFLSSEIRKATIEDAQNF